MPERCARKLSVSPASGTVAVAGSQEGSPAAQLGAPNDVRGQNKAQQQLAARGGGRVHEGEVGASIQGRKPAGRENRPCRPATAEREQTGRQRTRGLAEHEQSMWSSMRGAASFVKSILAPQPRT